MENNKIFVFDHPLIKEKLAYLRNEKTDNMHFRRILNELSYLIVYETTRNLKTKKIKLNTPLEETEVDMIDEELALIPVLRAGLGMVDGILNLIPNARIGHIGLYRDETTLQPKEYYCKLPNNIDKMKVFLLDPMLATGGSLAYAVQLLKDKYKVTDISIVSVISSPEGIKCLSEKHPDVLIYTTQIDPKLNGKGYIVPGLGDCGDRIFGTC